jgi:hypothetical protein
MRARGTASGVNVAGTTQLQDFDHRLRAITNRCRVTINLLSSLRMSARKPNNRSGSSSLFESHSHGNLNRCVFQISPEQWERCGFRCCIDTVEQTPFKNGKYPDPPSILFSRGLTADSRGVASDWLSWMQKLAAASSGGLGSCSEILCFSACFLSGGPCFLACHQSMIRNRVLRVVDQMNTEFLAPMQAFAKLFHCISTVRAGKHSANVKASWLAIGLTEDEIAKMKAEPDTLSTDTTSCSCCGGSGGV